MDEREEGFVEIEVAHVAECLGEEPRIQKVHAGMLRAADILVHREHLVDDRRVPRHLGVFVVGIAQVVPRGAHEGVHRVRVALRIRAADRAFAVHKACVLGERRGAVRREVDIIGELHREVLFRHRYIAAVRAVDDRDRRAQYRCREISQSRRR